MDGTWNNDGISESTAKDKGGKKKTARNVKSAPGGVYVVKSGDTLGKIAYAHGVSLGAVMKANNFDMKKASKLRVGQKIIIPGKDGKVDPKTAEKAKTPAKKAERKLNTALLNADGTYTVKAGDNIPKIARKLGVKAKDLQNVNNLSDEATRRLQIGQKLAVPGKSAPAAPVTPAAPQDDLNQILKEAETSPATPAVTPAPAATVTETAPAPAGTDNSATTDTTFVEITADTTLEEFAKANNTTAEVLRKLNAEISADGKLKAGELIFVPKK